MSEWNNTARYAFDCVKKVTNEKNDKLNKNYKSYARSAPMYIKVNGLVNTIAFYNSKKEKEEEAYKFLLKHIEEYFSKEPVVDKLIKKNGKDFLDELCGLDTANYMLATERTLGLIGWLKRFAEGMIEDNNNSNSKNNNENIE
ncbi:type III-B CRISPR module-associated protein Cmr5 [Methanococcus voltae]|uniref:CRISPR type III-B/RAMP module-associated protein Cmr5 n=1 Tax=Methanococcus voltae (strain ATCC BAA-1334 / A3) TaxID=456320 RepID=D7DSV0_METV3|nr:type III-B CRISPR module-associated protein Cmr5 [Methanococcus voltae]MCS3901810.1 CRISPR-associated protein Cmr5 [Methanococcus voltae]